jgi:hypothetical protein
MIAMAACNRLAVLITSASLAGLALAGCASPAVRPAGQVTPHPSATATSPPGSSRPSASPVPTGRAASSPAASSPAACREPGAYLTGVRAGQHSGYDRVVFQFSGGVPPVQVGYVPSVQQDPKGTPVPLAGQAYLHVVFHGATAWCPRPAHATYPGPATLTPYYPALLVVSAAGDFEGYLSFGLGVAGHAAYHISRLASPDRLVIDVSHVQLGAFPGIWDITSWPQYWAAQYAWADGHQPWLDSPVMVVQAWARSRWHTLPAIHQAGPNTFRVTAPGAGRVYTVTGTRPVTVPGPWVITAIR